MKVDEPQQRLPSPSGEGLGVRLFNSIYEETHHTP